MSVSLRKYLGILIAHPDLNEEGLNHLKDQFSELVSRHGGQIVQIVSLGKRKLAYRIGRVWEGHYLEIHMEAPPAGVEPLKQAADLLDSIVRLAIVQGSSYSAKPQEVRSGAGEVEESEL